MFPLFFALHDRQSHQTHVFHKLQIHAPTLHPGHSHQCSLAVVFIPLRLIPSRSSRSSTPQNSCISPVLCTFLSASSSFCQDLLDASDSIRLRCSQQFLSAQSNHSSLDLPRPSLPLSFAARECLNVIEPSDGQLLLLRLPLHS